MDIDKVKKELSKVDTGFLIPWFDGDRLRYGLFRKEENLLEGVRRGDKSCLINFFTLYNNLPMLKDPAAVFKGTERTYREVAEPDWELGDEGIAVVTKISETPTVQQNGVVLFPFSCPRNPSVFVVWFLPTHRDSGLMESWQKNYELEKRPDSKVMMFGWDESDKDDPNLPDDHSKRYRERLF